MMIKKLNIRVKNKSGACFDRGNEIIRFAMGDILGEKRIESDVLFRSGFLFRGENLIENQVICCNTALL